jgi:hypothetical protein
LKGMVAINGLAIDDDALLVELGIPRL